MRFRLISMGEAGLVEDGGTSVEFPVGKPFGILAYLSLSTDPVPRDELAAVFWAGSDPSRARHSLRQALSFIRRRLGDDVFATDDPVTLEPTVLETDVDLLRQALRDNDIDEILALYRGPFLETFQLASSPAWDHWVEIQRRILEERVAAALREEAERTASLKRSIALLRRAVEIEPHRFGHRRALVDALLIGGDVAGATAVLAETRQSDVEAADELAELESRVAAIREDRRARAEGDTEIHPEFVGRTAEMAALTATWRDATRGRRRIAILNGPTGIGKTRLAEEFAAVVATSGQVVHVKASSMEQRLDWSMTAELARSLYQLPGAAGVGAGAMHVLRSLVPSLGGSDTPSPTITPRPVAIADALVDLVDAVAYEAPLLMVLDDMQWVDRASLSLLLRVIRQVRDEPVMVLLTFRSEELGSREHEVIAALIQEEEASVHLIHTLAEGEVQEMLTLDLAEAPERIERLAARLHAVTRGHPLFLVELLRSLRDDGVLVPGDDGWRFQDPDPVHLELPASVRLVIDKRLEQLGADARRLGAELAALPPSSGLERVRARSGLSDAAFTAALNELLDRAVVAWAPDGGRLVFTHDQLREAMAAESKRRRPWRHVAAALMVVVAGLMASLALGTDTPKRWGGGIIVVPSGDSLVAVDPAAPPERWTAEAAPIWVPDVSGAAFRFTPRRILDGRVVWTGSIPGAIEAPDGVVLWGPGRRTERSWPGDDNVQDISPNGRRLAWVTQHYGGDGYAKDLRLVDLDADSGRAVAGPASYFRTLWAPDGTRVAVSLSLAEDSLLILSPDGDRLARWSFYQVDLEDWCGSGRVMAVIRRGPTEERTRLLLDLQTGAETVLDRPALPEADCSPDGSAYVSRQVDDGGMRLVVTDIGTGDRYRLPTQLNTGSNVFWVRDSVPPVPVGLAAVPDTLQIDRGATHVLRGTVQLSNGSQRAGGVRWQSADPSIASVLSDTTLAANRPGETRVIGEFAGWWTDTVVVRVVDGDRQSLVLADDFRSLDPALWLQIGRPQPDIARVEYRNVLELRGDGRYSDGVVSRVDTPCPAGFTVELDLQMPMTDSEYQGFALHVGNFEPPEDPNAWDHLSAWHQGDAILLAAPAFELDKWEPDLIAMRTVSRLETVVRLPEGVDLAAWTHLALQVQADGGASLWIDRRRVAQFRMPAGFLHDPLRVAILGDAYNTHAYVRDLTWWSEPRYR